jgi:hypothetical protein
MGVAQRWLLLKEIETPELDDELCIMQGDIHSLLTSTHYSSVHDFAHANGLGRFFSILLALKLKKREAD